MVPVEKKFGVRGPGGRNRFEFSRKLESLGLLLLLENVDVKLEELGEGGDALRDSID